MPTSEHDSCRTPKWPRCVSKVRLSQCRALGDDDPCHECISKMRFGRKKLLKPLEATLHVISL